MAAKKITRKQLLKEPDEFITLSSRFIQFAVKYKFHLLSAVGTFFAVLICISGFLYFSKKAENKAYSLMQQGITTYESLLKTVGPEKALQAVSKDFEFILEKYSDKDAGKLTRVSYANMCYQAGEYDKAISLYLLSVEDMRDLQPFNYVVLSGLGYAYLAKKEYPSAIKYFQMIVSEPGVIMKDEAYYNLGKLYAIIGDQKKSNDSFKKILSDYPDSLYVQIVKDKVTG